MPKGPCLLLFVFTFIGAGFSQTPLSALERAWVEDRFEEIERLLPAAEKAHPNHPSVLFFRALVSEDADKAFAYYKKVLEPKDDCKYAETALLKMAQYQYAQERYSAARRTYQLLQKQFPRSRWVDDSIYLIGQSYLAEGKSDSARITWRNLIKAHPSSPYADLAVSDLEQPPDRAVQISAPVSSKPVETKSKSYYAIQVGAFSQVNNAKTILLGLEKVGYTGQIVEKKVGSRIFWAVWIGRFTDRAAAEEYAKRFILKMTKEYQIVKSE